MIEFTPAQREHFQYLQVVTEQSAEFAALWKPGYMDWLLRGVAYTGWHSGVCLGASGISTLPDWQNRGECWFITGREAHRHILAIVRFMRFVLSTVNIKRLDMLVTDGNETGHKLAQLCGFEYEARLEAYHPLGCDAHMYKKVKR